MSENSAPAGAANTYGAGGYRQGGRMNLSSIVPGDISSANTAAPKNTFFKLTPEICERLIGCDLSKNDMKLWLYLVAIAPFGDRPYAYSAPQVMLVCGLKKTTYFRSKAKLQKLDLIDFRDGETKFINRLAPVPKNELSSDEKLVPKMGLSSSDKIVPKMGLDSQKWDSSSENGTRLPKMGLTEAETRSEQGLKSLQTIQTNLESTDNVLVDLKKIEEEEEQEASQGADASGIPTEPLEPTGVLEEPQPDPIAQVQQATVHLADEREIFDELRRLGIETNETVRATMKKFKANVPDAIAHMRQRYNNNERFMNITGAFMKACKEGAKPRSTTRSEMNPPTIEQMCQLEQAKAAGSIRDFYDAPLTSDRSAIVVDTGSAMMPWWEYLA
jgi:hypothetical protein